ncbi:hypothetical protein WH47_01863 [Habropoda laboriosa]|uniref:Uncharacterized protein n=1 Tax=Habropoda laboriosa TaxID=597456 RepID=A0A0L7QUD3_9HYME|nr:hypothetical protein WH47_01863 [Habropoda laboriosa]
MKKFHLPAEITRREENSSLRKSEDTYATVQDKRNNNKDVFVRYRLKVLRRVSL